MPYELFLGWRYLRGGKLTPALRNLLILAIAETIVGVILFLFFSAPILSAILISSGTMISVAMILLMVFSTFTAVSILGLGIGVAILVVVLSVTSGFQEEFRRKVLGVNAHVLVFKYGTDFKEYNEVARTAESVSGVSAAAPFIFTDMMIAYGNRLTGALIKGVDPQRVGRVLDLPQHLETSASNEPLSNLLSSSRGSATQKTVAPPGIVIGKSMAKKLGIKRGDLVRLISVSSSNKTNLLSTGELPSSKEFRVNAIFDSGFEEYDKHIAYVHLHEAQQFLGEGDTATGIEMRLVDIFQANRIAEQLALRLEPDSYRVLTWAELNDNLFSALFYQKLILQIVIGLIVVVAAFNVLAALVMLVIRKTREIAILKSMGVSARGIAYIFQSAGVVIWFIGTVIGIGLGYWGTRLIQGFPLEPDVYLISQVPIKMNWREFLLAAIFSLVVCMAATLYPAKRASRLDPIEGLRYE